MKEYGGNIPNIPGMNLNNNMIKGLIGKM